jgi:hypothetical protein
MFHQTFNCCFLFLQVGYECISLVFHPFGAALAAGSTEGHLIIINAENGATMLTLRVCGSPLNCIEYNQGEQRLFSSTFFFVLNS